MDFSYLASAEYWMGVLYRIPAVLLALSIHECAHAFAAYKAGDPTARNLGRMTLDPVKHIDPIGMLCLLFFRFGWAKPVPINSRNFKHYKRDNVLVSLSGIISNFILSFIMCAIWFIVINGFGVNNEIFNNIMCQMVMINISLAIFNLLPIPPLDGFQVMATFLSKKASGVVNVLNRYGFIILIVLIITSAFSFILINFITWLTGVYDGFFALFMGGGQYYSVYNLLFLWLGIG